MNAPLDQLFNEQLIAKYDTAGPRYTSYPTAVQFQPNFDNDSFVSAVRASPNEELSAYIHIPFCHSLCYYCGCNKIVTRNPEKVARYLHYLKQEIAFRAPHFKHWKVNQLHFGGGTPSYLSPSQMQQLLQDFRQSFDLADDAEISIEIDPRNIEVDYVERLAKLGFSRISIGVQDTNQQVQQAINREQSTRFIQDLIDQSKQAGIKSVNVDLVYGLPLQTKELFADTLKQVMAFDPDRVSLFSYAHLPERFAAQRKIKDEWLPSANLKVELMRMATNAFSAAGYEMIGMDHFAKPQDELALARRKRNLGRNFQGYTVGQDQDLIGLGLSAISSIGNVFSQNQKVLNDYYQYLDEHHHAIEKGVKLTNEDQLRGYVIRELMCNLYLDKVEVEEYFEIEFDQYFAKELASLQKFIDDGLLEVTENAIRVFEPARLFIRSICMSFDAYLSDKQLSQRFSRII